MSKEPIKKLPSLDLTKASPDPKDLPIILIGETHCDQAPSLLLQELMPFFKEMGYGFCFETDSRNSLDQTIKKYREMIGHFDRFIPEQSSEIAKLGGWLDPKNSKEIISQIIKSFNKQQHESNIIGLVTNSRNEDKLENFGTAEASIKATSKNPTHTQKNRVNNFFKNLYSRLSNL